MSASGFFCNFDEVMANMSRLNLGRKCIGVSWTSLMDKNDELVKTYPGKPEVTDCFLCKLIIEYQNSKYDKVIPVIEEPIREDKKVLTDKKILKIENLGENEEITMNENNCKYSMYKQSYSFKQYETTMKTVVKDAIVVKNDKIPNWQRCKEYPEEFKEYEIDISKLLEWLQPNVAKKVMAMCAGFRGDIFKKYTNWYSLGHLYHERERNIITIKILIGDDVENKITQVYQAIEKNIKHNTKKYFKTKNI